MTHSLLRPCILLLTLLLAIVIPGCDDGDKDAIRETWDSYCQARADNEPEKMLKLIDPENITYYDNIVRLARSGTKLQLQKISNWELLQVSVLRGTMNLEELKAMDGRKLFTTAYGQGWSRVGDDFPTLELTNLKLRRPRATANLSVEGIELPISVEFVQVNDAWVLNAQCMDEWMNERIKEVAKVFHTTEEGVVIRSASMRAGKELHKAMWDEPPKQ